MNLGDQLKRVRRFLRDPDGNLWSRAVLVNLYNDVQRDLQMKLRYLEDVVAIRVPPLYHMAYLHDWEWPYLSSKESQFYRALRYHYQGDFTFCHIWESQSDHSGDASDDGYHFTQPWEVFISGTPGELIKIRFPSDFHTAKLLAHDWQPLSYKTKKQITNTDSDYVKRTGRTFCYYREDDLDNSFIPYPLPDTIAWQDVIESPIIPDFLYTQSWESTYLDGTGEMFGEIDSDQSITYVFVFETAITVADDSAVHGMWLFETDYTVDGMVVYVSSDTTESNIGVLVERPGSLFNQETGIAVDVVDGEDSFILIYDAMPTDLAADDDESSFPVFLRKYIEYGVTARAYRANTDGKIKTLSDYWEARYNAGIVAIKKFMGRKRQDRDYRLVTKDLPSVRSRRHPRLPSTYPAV